MKLLGFDPRYVASLVAPVEPQARKGKRRHNVSTGMMTARRLMSLQRIDVKINLQLTKVTTP